MYRGSALGLLPLLGLAACALLTQKQAWPDHDARTTVSGPTDTIEIHRDEFGIPHIRGATETDAMYALGFAHAQDRLFQADLTRRLIYGEASTLLGERTVEFDGFVRGLGVRERARDAVQDAPFEVQAILEAYSTGFNAALAELEQLPVEYRLLKVEDVPPWTPADCVANVYLQSWALSENSDKELAALALSDLGADKLDRLLRYEAETPPLQVDWDSLRTSELGEWTPGWRAWNAVLGGGIREPSSQASNNWIVGPERSADGMPIVANDPHLGQRVPSIWYPADIKGGDLHVAGVTFAGTPAVVIGHNHSIAWGLTNVMADYVDFAIVETADEGESVIVAGEKVKLVAKDVRVDVRGAEPVNRTVFWSPIGPVITDTDKPHAVILRWHALELEDESTVAFFGLNNATTVTEAIDAMSKPMVVAQNLVVADTTGDYAWQAVGSTPIRKAHTGRVPYPGSDPEHGWDGYYTVLPGERAPERGFVATANSRPTVDRPAAALGEEPTGDPIDVHGISTGWAQGWRLQRIEQLLRSRTGWTPDSVAAMQTDVKDIFASTLLPKLTEGVEGSNSQAKRCVRLLRSWDHEADTDSIGTTVWITFQRELLREALIDDLGEDGVDVYLQVQGTGRNLLGVGIDDWVEDRADAVDRALTVTCNRLDATLGEYEGDWMWGKVHRLRLTHPFADGRKLLAKWNAPEVGFPGNSATVAAASAGWQDGEKRVGGMASVRVVMPLSDLTKSTLVHPGGQSGLPRHPQAMTHFDAFVAGETLPLYTSDQDVAEHTVSTQLLQP